MSGLVAAVLLSLLSAVGYAFAAVTQSRLAGAVARDGGGNRSLAAQPLWWWAVGLNGAGALAHVGALHYGPLTLVQPLGALTLVAALPLAARRDRRRVVRAEWRGALCTLAGLVGLISVTGPAAPGDALSVHESLSVAAACGLLIAVLARGRGLGHATASGVASGVASALTQTVTASVAGALPGGAAVWWQTTLVAGLVAVLSVGGLLLSQRAYRSGLAAPLALVNLSNPAAAAVIGVVLLGETFRAGGWGWLVAAASAALAARGVVLLTRAVPSGADSPEAPAPAEPAVRVPAPGPEDRTAAGAVAPAAPAAAAPAVRAPVPAREGGTTARTAGVTATGTVPEAAAPGRLLVLPPRPPAPADSTPPAALTG